MESIQNPDQYEAIHSEGPTLVIAGPGTGKTYTIIQRVLYLIRDRKVKPEQIMIVTYTVKASKELMTRLTNELSRQGIEINLHEMYRDFSPYLPPPVEGIPGIYKAGKKFHRNRSV